MYNQIDWNDLNKSFQEANFNPNTIPSLDRALLALEARRRERYGEHIKPESLRGITFENVRSPENNDLSFDLIKSDLTPSKQVALQLMQLVAPVYASRLKDLAISNPTRVPDLSVHGGYLMFDQRNRENLQIEILVSFQQSGSYILPQHCSDGNLENGRAQDRYTIYNSNFAGLILRSGVKEADLPRIQSGQFENIKVSRIELHACREVIKQELQILESFGQGGHFDPLFRGTIAQGLAQRLKTTTENLSNLGVHTDKLRLNKIERGVPTLESISEQSELKAHFRTRFPGGSAEIRSKWNPTNWSFGWELFSIKLRPNELFGHGGRN